MCNHKKVTVYPPQMSNNPLHPLNPYDEDERIAELLKELLDAQIAYLPENSCQKHERSQGVDYAIIFIYFIGNLNRLLLILLQPIQDNLIENKNFKHTLFERAMPELTKQLSRNDGIWITKAHIFFNSVVNNLHYTATVKRGSSSRCIDISSGNAMIELSFPTNDIPILVERMKMFNEWFKHRDLDDDLTEWNPKTSFEISDGVLRVR